MLGRVAESLYWMFRNVERIENLSRFLEVSSAMDLDSGMAIEPWTPLIDACGDRELFEAVKGNFSAEEIVDFLVQSKNNPSSIRNCLNLARENARQIRDVLSNEMWEHLNTMYWQLKNEPPMTGRPSQEWLLRIRQGCQLFYGIADVCFSRGLGWQFCQLGRLVERADKTARILDVKYFLLLPHGETVGGVVDQLQWIAVLKTAGGYQMFRQSRQLSITPKGVAQFLLLDPNFPRSVRFCLDGIYRSLGKVDPLQASSESPLGRHVGMMKARWTYTDIAEIIKYGLHESIDRLQQDLNDLHNQLEKAYFRAPQSFPPPRSSIQRTP